MGDESVEVRIMRKVVREALNQGFALSVFDGEEMTVRDSRSFTEVTGAMRSSDGDFLHLRNNETGQRGWVRFIYGNEEDVLADYTTNLEPVLADINQWINENL